jgi:hypothetical protein
MERVIVTVKKFDEARVRDLDLPAAVASDELADLVASALNWDQDNAGKKMSYNIQADPPGRVLESEESLLEAGIVDGAWLTFILEGAKPLTTPQQGTPSQDREAKKQRGPIKGWKSLEGVQVESMEGADLDDQNPDGKPPYVWKEVDI